ncbi:MAG: 4-hydroxy-tetrahydrodipicolinate reductase [Flavobacteriaceae bacterium]|nr:4-hydroxy-tetrahydrodipicolinate reductase [Flavobacteriaceae bacterium]
MKIALLGYGKMGKAIEKVAIDRNHTIVAIQEEKYLKGDLSKADVSINFSTPKSAKDNIIQSLKHSIPVVCGTTGWLNDFKFVQDYCLEKNSAFLYSANFSIGVNLFFKLNEFFAKLIAPYNEYKPSIKEIHHINKADSPSGTAIKLSEIIINNSNYKNWTLNKNYNNNEIPISVKRIGRNPGNHFISYNSLIDSIKIEHKANSRLGFAIGAVIAAEWILNKKGIFNIDDILNIKI